MKPQTTSLTQQQLADIHMFVTLTILQSSLSAECKDLIALWRNNPALSVRDLAADLGVSYRTAYRLIDQINDLYPNLIQPGDYRYAKNTQSLRNATSCENCPHKPRPGQPYDETLCATCTTADQSLFDDPSFIHFVEACEYATRQ